jgi:hypothetical protein
MRFPDILAHDLEGREYRLPDGLPEGPRLIMVAFQRWHTVVLARWQPALERMVAEHPGTTLWELPALSRMYAAARPYIDGGMRAGIPDPAARRMTLTTYTDLRAFGRALELPSFDTVYILLLDASGEVVWFGGGEADDAQLAGVHAALDTLASVSEEAPAA